ncbi:MAG: urease accessory protein [bacterium]|nr:urease accessory protein [bacterium]
MSTVLLLGFLLGMRHSLEADHIAAVASLITRNQSMKNAVRQGAVWGVGHILMLFVFGAAALLFHSTISQTLAMWLELLVGAMLVMLGLDVIYRLIRDRVHYHIHDHDREIHHFHAHSHKNEKKQKPHPRHHAHEHHGAFPKRALFVGMMHGMAGSAVLIVMTLQSIKSIWTGLFYIALFGIGSIIGMAALTVIIAIPLQKSSFLTRFHNVMQALIGTTTIVLGLMIMHTFYAGIISVPG